MLSYYINKKYSSVDWPAPPPLPAFPLKKTDHELNTIFSLVLHEGSHKRKLALLGPITGTASPLPPPLFVVPPLQLRTKILAASLTERPVASEHVGEVGDHVERSVDDVRRGQVHDEVVRH